MVGLLPVVDVADDRRLDQHHQFLLAAAGVGVAEQRLRDPVGGAAWQARVVADRLDLHQPADRDDVAVCHTHHGIGFVDAARGQRQLVAADRSQVDPLGDLAHGRHRGVHVQRDGVGVVDLRRHIECDAREERRERQRGQRRRAVVVAGVSGIDRAARHIGDEILVSADLEHRFLVVQRGDPRARQDLHVAVRLQEAQHRLEAIGRDRQAQRARACGWHRHAVDQQRGHRRRQRRQAAVVGHQGVARNAAGLADGAVAPQQRPVDAALEALAQFDLDDLRLQHHLTLERQPRGAQVVFHLAQLFGHGANGDGPRLRAGDHVASVAGAHDAAQCFAGLCPDIGARGRRDLAAVQRLAAVRVRAVAVA